MADVVASFVYVDERSTPRARIDRIEPGRYGRSKDFLPYLADGRGGFFEKPGLNGTKLPPYHLDEVRAAIAACEPIFLVEGEGKGDVLRDELAKSGRKGAVTTIQGGANAAFREEHVATLAGAMQAYVLTDSDNPGRCAARLRAQKIADAYPASDVRIVDPYPDRNDGSDIADFFSEGRSIEELLGLLDVAPIVMQSPAVPLRGAQQSQNGETGGHRLPVFVRAGNLLSESDSDDVEYVIDKILPLGGTGIIAGRPKGGKSTLAMNAAVSVARGESFLGRETLKGPVLYVALEGAGGVWKALIRGLGVTYEDDVYVCIGRTPDAAIQWLNDAIKRYRPVLVIIDTMQRFLRVKDGNDYATGSNSTDAIIELARTAKVALLLLHHSGKTRHADIVDEVMGSTAWAAAVDTVLLLRKSERFRTLASQGRVGEDLPETVVEMDPLTRRVHTAGTKAGADLAEMREAIERYLEQIGEEGADEPTIDKNVEGRTKTKRDALRELVAAGRVVRTGTGRRGDPYRYFACSLVPDIASKQENEKPESGEISHAVLSCSRDSTDSQDARNENPSAASQSDADAEDEQSLSADDLFAYANVGIADEDTSSRAHGELDL